MKFLDKQFITLQIRNKFFSLNANEFQSFFETLMELSDAGFKKIRPYGNIGDGGNDGYNDESGIFYQAYAPITPKVKGKDASDKLKEDFNKLQEKWGKFKDIKKYIFVFNDKYLGSTLKLESALEELKERNPAIEFELCLAKDLQNKILALNQEDLLALGFIIDQLQSTSIIQKSLDDIHDEIDRENVFLAEQYLNNINEIAKELGEENITLEYELLVCKYLIINENQKKAEQKYANISTRYPNDPRSFIYLAEIHLNHNNKKKYNELIDRAEKIDSEFWLINFLKLVSQNRLGGKFNRCQLEEIKFPNDPRIKANFYRLFAQLLEESSDEIGANEFIEKSIFQNPNRFKSYITRLSLWLGRLIKDEGKSLSQELSEKIINEISSVEELFTKNGEIRSRNQATLNSMKIDAMLKQGNFADSITYFKETFDLLFNCSLDPQIENIIFHLLYHVTLPNKEFTRLLEYVKKSDYCISDYLTEELFGKFLLTDSLFTRGRGFFEEIKNQEMVNFIEILERGEKKEVLEKLKKKERFSFILAGTLKDFPEIRLEIIKSLPYKNDIQKKKNFLLFFIDEKKYDEAFPIITELDLSTLNAIECLPILEVLHKKEAWDMEIMLLEKMVAQEKNDTQKFRFSMQLFSAYLNMEMYQETIEIGEYLLKEDKEKNYLEEESKIIILNNTIVACFERGKIVEEEIQRAKKIIDQYKPDHLPYEFKVGAEFEVLFRINEPKAALSVIIDGVKEKQLLSNQEYAWIHFQLLKIDNLIGIGQDSLSQVEENYFVKLSNNNQWYFIGEGNALDAISVEKHTKKYGHLLHKKLNSNIVIPDAYGPDIDYGKIEKIFPIEKYIYWQSIKNFQGLSQKGDLKGVHRIQIPHKEDSIDPENLIKFLQNERERTKPFFDMYCENKSPLAMLAMSEGGLFNAIGHITQEELGFINFSDGTNDDLEKQKQTAKSVVDKKQLFIIDGTSAFFLIESGLLQKIHKYLPNMIIPRSVLNFLADVTDRFRYLPGLLGHMGYAKGKKTISNIDEIRRSQLQKNFVGGIKQLESNPKNIKVISKAKKENGFTEKEIPEELCDACIIAKMESKPVLTEDPIYLKFNEIETKRNAPSSFSIWSLARVLYEMQLLSFNDYLEFFGYLSFYRFRFLPISVDDINKAIFGDKTVATIQPERIRYFNFRLTFSEKYGVKPQLAYGIIAQFLIRILVDTTVTVEATNEIFLELINELPSRVSKRKSGRILLNICHSAISNFNENILSAKDKEITFNKIDYLYKSIIFLYTDQ